MLPAAGHALAHAVGGVGDSHQLRGALAVVVAVSAHPYRLALFTGTAGAVAASQPANERTAMKAAAVFCALVLLAGQAGDFAGTIKCWAGPLPTCKRWAWRLGGTRGAGPSCPLLLRFWPIGSLQASLKRRANRAGAHPVAGPRQAAAKGRQLLGLFPEHSGSPSAAAPGPSCSECHRAACRGSGGTAPPGWEAAATCLN